MRTVGSGRRIVEFEAHLRRLNESSALSFPHPIPLGVKQLVKAIRYLLEPFETETFEHRITVLLLPGDPLTMKLAREDLPLPPLAAQVEFYQATRENPEAKSTSWVIQRSSVENSTLPDTNEVILVDDQGDIYEGLSSNFAIVDEDAQGQVFIMTAPRGTVLTGTMIELVKEVCPSLGFDFREGFPCLEEVDAYKAIFITSTSRLVLPVNRLILWEKTIVKESSQYPPLIALQDALKDIINSRSVPIYED